MREVPLSPRSLADLAVVVPRERIDRLVNDVAPRMLAELSGHSIVTMNSTASGGGVAEMLHVLLPLCKGVGLAAPWFVLEGEPELFVTTKRLHHRLHGNKGDDGELGPLEQMIMRGVAEREAPALLAQVTPGDVVILHDPQPAGLAPYLAKHGVPLVWRCHVGVDLRNEYTDEAWEFLRPLLEGYVDAYVFTREEYAPDWVPRDRLHIIKPSIDPLAPKNQFLSDADVAGALRGSGILAGEGFGAARFTRTNGSMTPFDMTAEIVRSGPAPKPDEPIVVQVSRWDPLKDMAGVMRAFVSDVAPHCEAHLMLVGPAVTAVSDDPEGQLVLDAVTQEWRGLAGRVRDRVHLVSLPMDDPEQNGALVNAIQRHAAVVVQKSLAEGFGLTVTEAMFKGRPVVASAVGGIVDQIQDGVNGLLVRDPRDPAETGAAIVRLLSEPELAAQMGAAARQRVIDTFLPDTSLDLWNDAVQSALRRHNGGR